MGKQQPTPIELTTLAPEEVEGERVEIRFVPLSIVAKLDQVLWQRNVKKHDLPLILSAIEKYGFIDPPKWDSNLNDGQGGLIYGNGRTQTLVQALLQAQREGHQPPRGIPSAKATGEWCIPIKFGVDAQSEEQAIAAAIDHNNLTLSGADFEPEQIAEIWETEYLDLLQSIAESNELPVTVPEESLADLLLAMEQASFSPGSRDDQSNLDQESEKKMTTCICPNCGHEFQAES